ncbi:NUDIX domain-containing protein [Candidatus Parcubacteria bacterium]|nr:MAG: NUDIX domain-containing protein [Candidatus Parcubacteria bacterium]
MERIAGIVVFNPLLQKFLVLHSKFGFDLPKGHLEIGEDPLDGAKRECYEETGLQPSLLPNFRIMIPFKDKAYYFYIGITNSRSVKLSFEHDDAMWMRKDYALNALTGPLNKAMSYAIACLN